MDTISFDPSLFLLRTPGMWLTQNDNSARDLARDALSC
jgi:hypothetical protein